MSSIVPFPSLLGVFTLDEEGALALLDELTGQEVISEEVKEQVIQVFKEDNLSELPECFSFHRASVFSNTVEIFTIY